MRGVGGEAAHPEERSARVGEQRVQGRRELVPFVVRAGHGQGEVQLGGTGGSGPPARLAHRRESAAREIQAQHRCRGDDDRGDDPHRGRGAAHHEEVVVVGRLAAPDLLLAVRLRLERDDRDGGASRDEQGDADRAGEEQGEAMAQRELQSALRSE